MRSHLLVVAVGLAGCAHFPDARLVQGSTMTQLVRGPVVCGPLGFRRVPLQARWGEYVRVTVSGPSALRGNVLVHAGGVAREPLTWSSEGGATLVVDARFTNDDPDARFALRRESPIDITLTGLEAVGGGSCEGAVFTVEHGALVPSIDERAWMAELARRGGPELAARREAARQAQDAVRQAGYAAWEARRRLGVSAEVLAKAEAVRQQGYAAWEARRAGMVKANGEAAGGGAQASAVVVVNGQTAASEKSVASELNPWSAPPLVSVAAVELSSVQVAVRQGDGSVTGARESVAAPSSSASAVVVVNGQVAASESSEGSMSGASEWAAPPSSSASAMVVVNGQVAASETDVGLVSSSSEWVAPPSSSATAMVVVNGQVAASETDVGSVSSASEWAGPPSASASAMVVVNGQAAASETSVGSMSGASEWAGPPSSNAMVVVDGSVAVGGLQGVEQAVAQGSTSAEWSQPFGVGAQVSTESAWSRPSEASLEPVAVSRESRVAVGAEPAAFVPQPPPCPPASTVTVSVDPAADTLVPALLQFMFDVAASAPVMTHPGHAARPLRPSR